MKNRDLLQVKLIIVLLATVSFAASCEYHFEPIKEGDYNFSMYGVLDLNADTQWVRVTPVRDTILLSSKPLDIEVTLTNESTGEVVTLEDSLFKHIWFTSGSADTAYVWNYWTDYQLEAEEVYTVQAEGTGGLASSATVAIPAGFPVPVVEDYNQELWEGLVTGSGIDRIVVAETAYSIRIGFFHEIFRISQLEKETVSLDQESNFIIDISDRYYAIERYGGNFTNLNVTSAEITIASSNDSWPDVTGLSEEETALPDVANNVENGLGVIAGIASITMPLEVCFDDNGEVTACEPLPNPHSFIQKERFHSSGYPF